MTDYDYSAVVHNGKILLLRNGKFTTNSTPDVFDEIPLGDAKHFVDDLESCIDELSNQEEVKEKEE